VGSDKEVLKISLSTDKQGVKAKQAYRFLGGMLVFVL